MARSSTNAPIDARQTDPGFDSGLPGFLELGNCPPPCPGSGSIISRGVASVRTLPLLPLVCLHSPDSVDPADPHHVGSGAKRMPATIKKAVAARPLFAFSTNRFVCRYSIHTLFVPADSESCIPARCGCMTGILVPAVIAWDRAPKRRQQRSKKRL